MELEVSRSIKNYQHRRRKQRIMKTSEDEKTKSIQIDTERKGFHQIQIMMDGCMIHISESCSGDLEITAFWMRGKTVFLKTSGKVESQEI